MFRTACCCSRFPFRCLLNQELKHNSSNFKHYQVVTLEGLFLNLQWLWKRIKNHLLHLKCCYTRTCYSEFFCNKQHLMWLQYSVCVNIILLNIVLFFIQHVHTHNSYTTTLKLTYVIVTVLSGTVVCLRGNRWSAIPWLLIISRALCWSRWL
jgi:hypothetical protein